MPGPGVVRLRADEDQLRHTRAALRPALDVRALPDRPRGEAVERSRKVLAFGSWLARRRDTPSSAAISEMPASFTHLPIATHSSCGRQIQATRRTSGPRVHRAAKTEPTLLMAIRSERIVGLCPSPRSSLCSAGRIMARSGGPGRSRTARRSSTCAPVTASSSTSCAHAIRNCWAISPNGRVPPPSRSRLGPHHPRSAIPPEPQKPEVGDSAARDPFEQLQRRHHARARGRAVCAACSGQATKVNPIPLSFSWPGGHRDRAGTAIPTPPQLAPETDWPN